MRSLWTVVLLASAASAAPAPALPVAVSASCTDFGPHGELWIAQQMPEGDLYVRVSDRGVSGQTNSYYFPSAERTAALHKALAESRFFELGDELRPGTLALHRPHFRVTATLGAKTKTVAVWDPETLGATPETKRFFLVWDALFGKLPFKPALEAAR